jgi:hypothetical protein
VFVIKISAQSDKAWESRALDSFTNGGGEREREGVGEPSFGFFHQRRRGERERDIEELYVEIFFFFLCGD